MSFIIDTGAEAYQKLSRLDQDPILWADILRIQAVRDLFSGDFQLREERARVALQIRVNQGLPKDLTYHSIMFQD